MTGEADDAGEQGWGTVIIRGVYHGAYSRHYTQFLIIIFWLNSHPNAVR